MLIKVCLIFTSYAAQLPDMPQILRQVSANSQSNYAKMSNALPILHENDYGIVIEENKNVVPGIDVQKVMLKVQEREDSPTTIFRGGILMYNPRARATVVICHGFMCDKFDIAFLYHLFPKKEFNCLIFDFRAHGEHAANQLCTLGKDEALDVAAAAQFCRHHQLLKDKPLLVYAFSMGAVSAIEAQSKNSSLFDAMILDCPFDSTENIIKRALGGVQFSIFGYQFSMPGKSLLEKYAFHPYIQTLVKAVLRAVSPLDAKNINICAAPVVPMETVSKITVPCFFIHCKNDEKVSVEGIKQIFSKAGGYKRLWITNGRHHFDSFFYNSIKYKHEVRQFARDSTHNRLPLNKHNKIDEDADDLWKIPSIIEPCCTSVVTP